MDPVEQSVAPVPASPEVAPAGLSQDQMKTNLQDLMSKIEARYQDFNAQKFSSSNKIQAQQGDTLRGIFDLLETSGVDPSNPEEVKAFLDQIRASNPELAKQLEEVLQSVLGEETAEPEVTEEIPSENMNMNPDATPPEAI